MSLQVSLGDIAELINGDRSSNYPSGNDIVHQGVLFLNTKNISNSSLQLDDVNFISQSKFDSLRRGKLQKNDLVITLRGTLGSCCIFDCMYETGFINAQMMIIRTNDSVCEKYLLHYLVSLDKYFKRIGSGSAVPQLTATQLKDLKIPLPPLKEQKRIAAILDKADAIRSKRQQAIDLTDQLLRSIFLDMFGNPKFAMAITELLDEEYLLLHKDGNHGGNYPRAEEFGKEGIPFISAKDISDDDGKIIQSGVKYLNEQKARKLTIGWLESGDVLLAHNATVGRVGIFQGEYDEALIGTSLTAFRPNPKKITSQYLFCALKYSNFQNQLKKNMGQSTRNQVPITAQKDMKIPIGDMVLQKNFGKYFDCLMRLKAKHLAQADCADNLFESLNQSAFRGELTNKDEAA